VFGPCKDIRCNRWKWIQKYFSSCFYQHGEKGILIIKRNYGGDGVTKQSAADALLLKTRQG
jgi:hypothetical protein